MVLDGYVSFITKILRNLDELNINVEELDMDHIGYQANSDEEYDRLKEEFSQLGEEISEKIVGGRRVGIYKLYQPLKYQQYVNPAIELIAPKTGQVCSSALDHVEFVINESFQSFMEQYPQAEWDVSAIDQPVFPMIKLQINKNIQVKFHLTSVLEIIKQNRD